MTELTQARVLVFMLGVRSIYRTPLISPHEVFCGPNVQTDLLSSTKTLRHPAGDVDLADILHRLEPDWTPEVVIVKADAMGANFVRNLDAFGGPRLLMVGDTHHLKQPLRKVLRYARSEPFDGYLMTHTPHHLEFIEKAGLEPLWSMPGPEANHYPQPAHGAYLRALAFVGGWGDPHRQRKRVLGAMGRARVPMIVEQRPPQEAAKRYAEAAISLNVSLNGDLNLRVWEVMSAGGLLLTDRLAPESRFDDWFTPGKHYLVYDSIEEAIALAKHYIAHPEEGRAIREAGHQRYLEIHDPARMWNEIGAKLWSLPRREIALIVNPLPASFQSELAQYEWLQERHRIHPEVVVESFDGARPGIGLPRIVYPTLDDIERHGDWSPWIEEREVFRVLWRETSGELDPISLSRFCGNAIRLIPGEVWPNPVHWGFVPCSLASGIFELENPLQHIRAMLAAGEVDAAHFKSRILTKKFPSPESCLELAHIWTEVGGSSFVGEVLESGLRAFRGDQRLWLTWVQWLKASGAEEATVFEMEASRWGFLPRSASGSQADEPMLKGWTERVGCAPITPSQSPQKILLITNLFPPQELGGYGRMMWEFAAGLVARGHEVKVLCADIPGLNRPAEEVEAKMVPEVHRILKLFGRWERGKAFPLTDQNEIKAIILHNLQVLQSAMSQWKASVGILGNLDFIGHPVLDRWLEMGIPIIHCVANKGPGYPVSVTPTAPHFHVAPCSDWNGRAMQAEGYPINEYTVVFPGARNERFFQLVPPSFDRLRICYASLVMPFKGAHVLVQALSHLNRWGIPFDCEIAGDSTDPSFVENLREECHRGGFSDQVSFPGFLDRDGLSRLFMRSNTLVFPSVFEEPFGISQVEAMASGLVVVSSGTGGASEIVEDGINGLRFESQNAFDLAQKLVLLAEDPALAERLSQAALDRAEVFNVKHSVKRLEDLFDSLKMKTKQIG